MNLINILVSWYNTFTKRVGAEMHLDAYVKTVLKEIRSCQSDVQLAKYARNYSGYVRQEAVIRCVELASPELLPIVISRLNDWVPEVRENAQIGTLILMRFANANQLLAALPEIHQLAGTGRTNYVEWIAQFEKNFIQRVDRQELINALDGENRKIARACFSVLRKYNLMELSDLINRVLTGPKDIFLALQSINLCSNLSEGLQQEIYFKAVKSDFGAVRTVALRHLLSFANLPSKDELAIASLLDPQSSVRTIVMNYLRKRSFDIHQFYRNQLQTNMPSSKRIQICLVSLSNLGCKDDLALIKSFTKDDRSSVRKAAFLAWTKLAEADKDRIALAALHDTSNRMLKLAMHMVRKQGAYIAFTSAFELLSNQKQFDLLLQFSRRRKWDWLECIGRLSSLDGLNLNLALELDFWISNSGQWYEMPTEAQRQFFNSATTRNALINLVHDKNRALMLFEQELARCISH